MIFRLGKSDRSGLSGIGDSPRFRLGRSADAGPQIPHVANAIARCLLPGTMPGFRCVQDDDGLTYERTAPRDMLAVMVVSGGSHDGTYSELEEFYIGYKRYGDGEKVLSHTPADYPYCWVIKDGDQYCYYNSEDSYLPPTSGWLNFSDDSPADITVTAGTVPNVAGYLVSGGTQDGIYTTRARYNNKVGCLLLGYNYDVEVEFFGLFWGVKDVGQWLITDQNGSYVYHCPDDVPTPDLCTTWYDANGNVMALSVTPVTQGELDAAIKREGAGSPDENDIAFPIGVEDGRNKYRRPDETNPDYDIYWHGIDENWVQTRDSLAYRSLDDRAFPWGLRYEVVNGIAPAPTVTRWDNVEANWNVVS